jgi:methyl-accepting chemotaxis protein
MGLVDDLTNAFKKGIGVLARKTDEYTKIGKIKVDIIGIKREIDKKFNELGGKTYQLLVELKDTKIAANDEVQQLITGIQNLNEQLKQKKEELDRVRAEYGKPPEDLDELVKKDAEAEEGKAKG